MNLRNFIFLLTTICYLSSSHSQPSVSLNTSSAKIDPFAQSKEKFSTPGLRQVFEFDGPWFGIRNVNAVAMLNARDFSNLNSLFEDYKKNEGDSIGKGCPAFAICTPKNGAAITASRSDVAASSDDPAKEKEEKDRQTRIKNLKTQIDNNPLGKLKTSEGDTLANRLKNNIDDLNEIEKK